MEEEKNNEAYVPTSKDIARRRIYFLGIVLVLIVEILILCEVFDIFTNTIA